MHGVPLAGPHGGNPFHPAVPRALFGEPGPVQVLHADQVIGFDTTALVRVLFVNTHWICRVVGTVLLRRGKRGPWLERSFLRNSMRIGLVRREELLGYLIDLFEWYKVKFCSECWTRNHLG